MKQPTIMYKVDGNKIIRPCRSIVWNDGEIESFTCIFGTIEFVFSNHFGHKDRYFLPSGNIEGFLLFH